MSTVIRAGLLAVGATALLLTLQVSAHSPFHADCTFLSHPEEFLEAPSLRAEEVSRRARELDEHLSAFQLATQPSERVERKNLIDDFVFGELDRRGIASAPPSSDAEFLRRVTLDLIGRIPTADHVEQFLADRNPARRDLVITGLVDSPEFVDKWTQFFGDLFQVNSVATNIERHAQGRDAMHAWLRRSIEQNAPYDRMASELIAASGDHLMDGPVNWIVGGIAPMGPVQDTFDSQAARTASVFLGLNSVDCLLCHDGARHLEAVNLWGSRRTRQEMWGLAAFFAQTRITTQTASVQPLYSRHVVNDLPTGEYLLNTTTGNRSPRHGGNRVAPRYFDSRGTAAGTRRQALAGYVTSDLQFARAAVNYIWQELMVEGFVTPADGFDPDRLHGSTALPEGWATQPNHPELLETLAFWFREQGFDVRALIALIVRSNAYQLSSAYSGQWKPEFVPLYARRFVRRLDAEEIHDAVVQATGMIPSYNLNYQGSLQPLSPVSWASQFPDTAEPRTNNTAAQFLNSFGRGDRDQTPRSSAGSILQSLNLMNHNFVMQKIHANNNGSHVQRLLASSTDPEYIVRRLFLATLSRPPAAVELDIAMDAMRRLGNTRGAEAVQWVLLNKPDFLHNY